MPLLLFLLLALLLELLGLLVLQHALLLACGRLALLLLLPDLLVAALEFVVGWVLRLLLIALPAFAPVLVIALTRDAGRWAGLAPLRARHRHRGAFPPGAAHALVRTRVARRCRADSVGPALELVARR